LNQQIINNLVSKIESKVNKVTSWSNTPNNNNYPSEKLVKDSLDNKADSTHTHTKSQITDFPSIPSASSTTPSADTTSGSVGNGTTWARSNHTHPKSLLYAEADHTHDDIQSFDVVYLPFCIDDVIASGYATNYDDDDMGGVLLTYIRSEMNILPTLNNHTIYLIVNNYNDMENGFSNTSKNVFRKFIYIAERYASDNNNIVNSMQRTETEEYMEEISISYDEISDMLSNKANSTHTHTKSQITDFPSIPSASSTTPSADTTSGSVGTGTTWARSNHTHPKSSLYAEASHNHTASEITDFQSVIPIKREDCIIVEMTITDVHSSVYFDNIDSIFDIDESNYPTIDWGDGDITDDTGEHLYSDSGKYEIKIQPSHGEIKILPSSIFQNQGQFVDNKITSIQIPSTVYYIGNYFCEGNSELKSIRLPSKVNMKPNAIAGNIEIEEIILSGKPYRPNLPRDNYNGESIRYLVEEKYYDEWEPFLDSFGISEIFEYNDDVVLLNDDGIGGFNEHAVSGSAISSALTTKANKIHTHNITDLNNTSTVSVVVTYTDETTETIRLLKYTGS